MTAEPISWIDIRSDTVTKPTQQMRKAMCEATYDYETDTYPAVEQLESMAAQLLQKEASVFLPSGVMSNQIAIMAWTRPGDQVITWDKAHITQLEQGAMSILSGVHARRIESETGVITAEQIEHYVKKNPKALIGQTALICVQNSLSNGRIWPLEALASVKQLADKYKLPVHMDGARLFNAKTVLGCSKVSEITQYADSVCFCLSKGLCCPIGSILAGTKEFIERARAFRDCLGGTFDNPAMLAAAGIVALNEMIGPLKDDHRIAKLIGQGLSHMRGIEINLSSLQSNMVFFKIVSPNYVPEQLIKHMFSRNIRMALPFSAGGDLRIVTHNQIRDAQALRILTALSEYIIEYC